MARLGLQVVVKSFYSPIPDLQAIPDSTWERESDLAGIHFDLEQQLGYLDDLAPYLHEFRPPEQPNGDSDAYFLENGSYGRVDADVLYATVRASKPKRIVELGSGYTTLVAAQACLENEREGATVEYRAFDPYPGVARPDLPGLTELVSTPAEELPTELFAELGEDDMLIVDTTHTVKTGGDVNHVVLDVLPRLRGGVRVHFHDIFLPWEYPRKWVEDYGLYWAEQYLLQAFLSLNEEFEILYALYALARRRPDDLRELVPSWRDGAVPGAFWIRRLP
jgi:methyltransferase family protein